MNKTNNMNEIIQKDKFQDALTSISKEAKVFLPVRDAWSSRYAVWDGRTEPYLERNATLPPKELLFPRSERLYAYDARTGALSESAPDEPDEKIVIVGIRPCDVRSVERLDKVFLGEEYADTYYRSRRENLTMVALACNEPAATCFCDSMDVAPDAAPGADVVMRDIGDAYALTVNTPKGERIQELIAPLLTRAEEAEEPGASCEAGESKEEENPKKSGKTGKSAKTKKPAPVSCSLKIDRTEDLHEKLLARFDDPMWETLADACLGCGCCSYICPTCYCFDIGRENRGSEGTAFRCWDSCMFSDYSRMAGGHNPRPTKKERLRNRYLHKLAYFTERYGAPLCVGCGRCIDKCPSGLDITNAPEIARGEKSNG
jgi:ferredoxin